MPILLRMNYLIVAIKTANQIMSLETGQLSAQVLAWMTTGEACYPTVPHSLISHQPSVAHSEQGIK